MFLAGIAVVALGLTGLPARSGGRRLRCAAAVLALVGVALAGTAAGLAGSAQVANEDVVIPALHDAANDEPIAYAPVCGPAPPESGVPEPGLRPVAAGRDHRTGAGARRSGRA